MKTERYENLREISRVPDTPGPPRTGPGRKLPGPRKREVGDLFSIGIPKEKKVSKVFDSKGETD